MKKQRNETKWWANMTFVTIFILTTLLLPTLIGYWSFWWAVGWAFYFIYDMGYFE